MEETKLSKTTSNKQNNPLDNSQLYQQCEKQLLMLNHHIAEEIINQRNAKLNNIIPSITSLTQQILQIQATIHHEQTQQEHSNQRQRLLQQKQNLLKNIQMLSKKIQKYKKQLITLNIRQQQLANQSEQNKRVIESKELSVSTCKSSQKLQNKSVLIEKKTTLPSIFSQQSSRQSLNRSILYDSRRSKQSQWTRIDKLFDKLSTFKFSNLANALVNAAKKQSGTIKGVFRNFKTNEKIGEYTKSHEVRKQLDHLIKSIKKQTNN